MTDQAESQINLLYEIFVKGQEYKDVLAKKELWKEIAKKLNGEFKIKQTISRDISTLILEIPYKNQMVVLTESDTRPLRSEINMDLKTKYELSLSWEGGVEKIMKIFGSQDIQIGNQAFDKKYLIQSNNSSQTISVLRDLKDLILKLNIYIINLHYEKSGQHKLLITKDRNSNTIDEIIGLIELNFRLVDFLFPKK
jgi:hypothetical protein